MLHAETGRAREAGACARAAPRLLAHLSFIFVLHGGALFATSARLKWDPITYIPVRELMPAEYRFLCFFLPLAGLALLALAHLAIAALSASTRGTRRALYLTFAVLTSIVVVSELVGGVLGTLHIRRWLRTEVAAQLEQTMEVREHLLQLLVALERWHPLPDHIKQLIHEAEADLPWNGYVAAAAASLLILAQILAVQLALTSYRLLGRREKQSLYKPVPSRRKSSGRISYRDRVSAEPGFR
ncbi:hypothetical protein O0L34_g5183 [Tuta absoluta]|nr:hypothetical protein O0L34_g5183 [Tuta absoluta]